MKKVYVLASVIAVSGATVAGMAAVHRHEMQTNLASSSGAAGRFQRLGPSGLGRSATALAAAVIPDQIISTSAANALSAPVSELPQGRLTKYPLRTFEPELERIHPGRPVPFGFTDPVAQLTMPAATAASATTAGGFAGIDSVGSGCGCIPPDTNGAVGPTQYVQMVNSAFAVFSKTGTKLAGPVNINTLFS